jgi:hypothetical protein
MTNLDAYLNKFSESGRRVLEGALSETLRRNQKFISPEHILYSILIHESELFSSFLANLPFDPESFRSEVEKTLTFGQVHRGEGFRIAPETTEIFKYSMDRARSEGRKVIDTHDILVTFLNSPNSLLNNILQKSVTDPEPVFFNGEVRLIDLDEKQFKLRGIDANPPAEIHCIYQNYSDDEACQWLNRSVLVKGLQIIFHNRKTPIIRVETVELKSTGTSD